MRSLAELGIGLSAVFGIFFLALMVELWYIFLWKRNGSAKLSVDCLRISATDIKARNAEFVRDASLVGSFGGYFSCTPTTEVVGGGSEFSDQPPHILFPIEEETKEDLVLELATGGSGGIVKPNSRLRTPSDVLTVPFTSGSSSPAASVDSSFTTPPSSPPTAKLMSPYAARAVRQVSCASGRASASPVGAEMHVSAGAGGRPIPPSANGRTGIIRTPLQLLFERSPLLGPAGAHMPSPFWMTSTTAARESSFDASPPPFYHRLSLGALFGQSPTACVRPQLSLTSPSEASIHEHQPH